MLHLSDVVDGTGRRLLPDVRNGVLHRESKLNWPRQILLSKWMPVWHKACGILQRYVSANCLNMTTPNLNQYWKWKSDSTHQYITDGHQIYERKTIKNYHVYTVNRYVDASGIQFTMNVDITISHKGRPKPIFFYNCIDNNDTSSHEPDTCDIQPSIWTTVFGDWSSFDSDIEQTIVKGLSDDTVIMGLDGSVTNER